MAKLAKRKGYRLVGANSYGFNTVYVRNDIAPANLPELTPEQILWHPRNKERAAVFQEIRDWEFVKV